MNSSQYPAELKWYVIVPGGKAPTVAHPDPHSAAKEARRLVMETGVLMALVVKSTTLFQREVEVTDLEKNHLGDTHAEARDPVRPRIF